MASRTLREAQTFARSLREQPPELIVSAGGDGTALALLNAMRRPGDAGHASLTGKAVLGLLPLGTGNGWASATGAPRWRRALAELGRLAGHLPATLPLRRFDLIEVDGTVSPFSGTGWDAELIDDFNAQKTDHSLLPERYRKGLTGYLRALVLRMIPRHLAQRELAEVELTNTGDDALTVDRDGRPVPLPGGEHGKVLYRGPMSVCGAATTSEWGFGFRAYPFAGVVPRRFHMRLYSGTAAEATMRSPALWRGVHPLPKMHNWLVTRCRAVFSRPVAFQIGGDRAGQREVIEYALADEQVDLLDWAALRAA